MSAHLQRWNSSVSTCQRPSTCLSSEEHDINIKDHLLHFLGCLEYRQRDNFFDETEKIWRDEIQHYRDHYPDPIRPPEERVRKKREAWKRDCDKELTRIEILRQAIRQDDHDRHLDDKIRESSKAWRVSRKNQKGVRDRPPSPRDLPPHNTVPKYNLERDISIPIIQYQPRPKGSNRAAVGVDDDGWGNEKHPEQRVWGEFPNQKTKLNLIYGKDSTVNLLHRDRHPERIKYFHIPSNNMIWAENALARYFDEDRPDRHAIQRELMRAPKTRVSMLLRDPFWRSQLHGGERAPPHARHMRPMCVTVSSDTNMHDVSPQNRHGVSPQNMVLFMPFLHWETSRQREKYARTIQATVTRHQVEEASNQDEWRRSRIRKRNPGDSTPDLGSRPPARLETEIRIDSLQQLVKTKSAEKSLKVDKRGRLKINRPLGQYMLDAARLFEGMSNYRDKKQLENYIGGDTPLHPRRTLDQAYHWTLNTTKKRDRDQVVYRATTTPLDEYHSFDPKTGKWPDHEDFKIEGVCIECRSRIKKVSRVIMVDQLWMWVLDAKTIITCFPKRYGVNKQDSSGVHKSIRRRLEATPQVRTVFDLGLIIFDECTNVFFDRTKTDPNQPPVLDAFSKAIGNIMHKQTAAFERLWNWTKVASDVYRSKNTFWGQLEVPLLDINPEGKLEREIKDTIEELDIMLHVAKCHRTVLKQYVHNADHMLDPYGEFGHAHRKIPSSLALYNKTHRQQMEQPELEENERAAQQHDYNWFRLNADELTEAVEGRIEELGELRATAVATAESVKDLLELKQQQASVVQTWQAVKQANETIKQGRSIMMFTLVTIVFLPLSFMSSIFGMNNKEFSGDDTWAISDEIKLMFVVSAVVIFTSLFWAYSGWSRGVLWATYMRGTAWITTETGIYRLWLSIKPKNEIIEKATRQSEELFRKVRAARFERNRKKAEKKEAEEMGHWNVRRQEATSSSARSHTKSVEETQEHRGPSHGRLQDPEMGVEMHHYG